MEIIGAVKGGNGGAKGLSVALVCSFLANAPGGVKLDSGKTIPQIRKGWKATDAEKSEAQAIFGKLKQAEKDEITEGFRPQIEKYLADQKAKNQLWKDYQAGMGGGRRNMYR
jgi:hypothetical protein